jgi:hypothetical protein
MCINLTLFLLFIDSTMNIEQPPSNFSVLPTQKYDPVYKEEPDEAQEMRREQAANRSRGQLFRIVVLASIFFVLLSQPVAYRITHKLAQAVMSSPISFINGEGCATATGIIGHGVIFFIIMLFIVY